ncbi:hypothetical protein [Nocardia tengchongensis]|uniref:Uncharacterized protein n=1 Tax=Nocardia tengchongensis TaxID=2055889 RepID=A0ABX8CN94_9NOCA|nr:hypothetical protein [Nocardia tengchongensis]QVI19660.1 hypothetical protein KHQ06_25305 [Nocardia tengchongensis]
MGEVEGIGQVVEMWPQPEDVASRWRRARVRIALQLTYGRASERRRARILARRWAAEP